MQVKPKLNTSLVAFIDLLGFEDQLKNVTTDKELVEIYNRVKIVHDIFDKDPKDSLTRGSHEAVSKRVISLSDAVIISLDFDSPNSEIDGILDIMAQELSLIGSAQALCVAEGIFLRGGLSLGYFFFENDILLSNAVIKSYAMEALACWPVIVLEPSFYDYFISHSGNECYSEETAPKNVLFYKFKSPKIDEPVYCLDYLRIVSGDLQQWHTEEDRLRYIAEKDVKKKQQILNKSYTKNELAFMQAHKESIEKELSMGHTEKIKEKYEWLKDYHNEFIRDLGHPTSYCIS